MTNNYRGGIDHLPASANGIYTKKSTITLKWKLVWPTAAAGN